MRTSQGCWRNPYLLYGFSIFTHRVPHPFILPFASLRVRSLFLRTGAASMRTSLRHRTKHHRSTSELHWCDRAAIAEAVLRLAPRLYDLHDRGHSWWEVAAWLTTQGLPVTTGVSRSRGRRPNASLARATKRESVLAAPPAKHDAVTSEPSADEPSVRLVNGGQAARRSAFEVRPHIDDI